MTSDIVKRKLTTIFVADVVGYSRLMSADEEATLKMLRVYREIIDGLIDKHDGRVFNTSGDAVLAEFGSAVEAVRCAISIQEDLRVRNAELIDDRQMWLRIGINVGDVMIEGDDLFGDGVNVAARLEGLAETGGICVSGSAFDQVKNKLSIAFNDIGGQAVKNIPEPVPAYRIVPGKVKVESEDASAAAKAGKTANVTGRRNGLMAAGAAVIVLLLGAVFFVGDFLPSGQKKTRLFDGRWVVAVSSLTGCRNNNSRKFSISVTEGVIDEPQQPNPKKGRVSDDGVFSFEATDRSGRPLAVMTGTIEGEKGVGRFRGGQR